MSKEGFYMKKIKSILALLLMGSLTMTGCDLFKKKNKEDTPADQGGGGGGGGGEHTEVKFTVTFNVQGHGTAPESVEVDEGGKITKPTDPSAQGYTFGGWFKEAACTNAWDFANDTVTANVTLYAKWTENATNLVSVTFNLQGHGDNWYVSVEPGETVSQPSTDPSAEGYTFGGWYKESTCETAWDFATMTILVDTVIYAKWTVAPTPTPKYSVTFDVQGHGVAPQAQSVDQGGKVTEPGEPSEVGYTFGGWYKEAGCINAWDFDEDTVSAATTLYAKWTKVEVFTNKKIVASSVAIDPESEQDTFGPVFANAFISFFDNLEFEMAMHVGPEHLNVQLGTYVVSADGLTATLTATKTYTTESEQLIEIPEAHRPVYTAVFAPATSNYSVTIQVGPGVTAILTGQAEAQAPEHIPVHPVPYVVYSVGDKWEYEGLEVDSQDSSRLVGSVALGANDEFAINLGNSDWRHIEDLNVIESTKKVTMGSGADETHNFLVTEEGTYNIVVDIVEGLNGSVVVTFEGEELFIPKVHFGDPEHFESVNLSVDKTVEHQLKTELTLEAGDEFVIELTEGVHWLHFEDYSHSPDVAGGKVVEGKENEDTTHNFKVTEDGVYKVFVKEGNTVYVVHDTTICYSLWLKDAHVLQQDPEFYAWVWDGEDNGHWVSCAVSMYNDTEPYIDIILSNSIVGLKLVRVAKDAVNKPEVGGEEYGEIDVLHETGNIDLDRVGAVGVDIYFEGGIEPLPYIQYGDGESWKYAYLEQDPDNASQMIVSVELEADEIFSICMSETDWRHYEEFSITYSTTKVVKGTPVDEDDLSQGYNFKAAADGTYNFYIQKAEHGSVFVTFEEEPVVVPSFIMYGNDNGWTKVGLVQVDQDQATTQYQIEGVELTAGQQVVFCVRRPTDTWIHYSNYVETAQSSGKVSGLGNDNLVILESGTYNFYVNGSNELYIVFVE